MKLLVLREFKHNVFVSRLQDHVTHSLDAPPPGSNDKTTVWYWTEHGQSTTLMLTKASGEVWCNGRILETSVSHARLFLGIKNWGVWTNVWGRGVKNITSLSEYI